MTTEAILFPPLFRGEALTGGGEPLAKAVAQAAQGIDPGYVPYRITKTDLKAAVVLAPETALRDAMAMLMAGALGFSDALGALAPPEVAVHFDWPARLRINGARAGALHAAASTDDPEAVPDWLIIGLDFPLDFPPDRVPGETPDETALWLEGCSDVSAERLLESWTRHFLVWINTWEESGMARLHTDWRGKAFAMGEDVAVESGGREVTGTFVGLDEAGGMLVRQGTATELLPLHAMLVDG